MNDNQWKIDGLDKIFFSSQQWQRSDDDRQSEINWKDAEFFMPVFTYGKTPDGIMKVKRWT